MQTEKKAILNTSDWSSIPFLAQRK